jgi:hypothetical protein
VRALDGPAAGVNLGAMRTCPTWLRLVVRPKRPDDARSVGVRYIDENLDHPYAGQVVRWDALDQPDDTPEPNEVIEIYRTVPRTWGQVFVRPGGRYEHADYRHVPVDEALLGGPLRELAPFRVWAVLSSAADTELGAIDAVAGANIARLSLLEFTDGFRALEPFGAAEPRGGKLLGLRRG